MATSVLTSRASVTWNSECLTAMHRALRFADRLRQAKNAPKIDRAKLRMMGVDQIRVLRDAIQHLDDTAAKGLLTE